MRHLEQDCNIRINGNLEEQQLVCYGYYHGYKGYRFFREDSKKIPYTSFSQVVAVIEHDSNVKAMLYPNLMFIETALKNIVCNETVKGLEQSNFDYVCRERMNDAPDNAVLQNKRIELRKSVDSRIFSTYRHEFGKDTRMVHHFLDRGEDLPLWVIFELFYLGDLARFSECLNTSKREDILRNLSMLDISVDSGRTLLSHILYNIKALRNAVAHNGVVFDTRFKDRKISPVVRKWVEKETGILNVTYFSLIDYIITLCCILRKLDSLSPRAENLISAYKEENDKLRATVTPDISKVLFKQNMELKIAALEKYLKIKTDG